MARRTKGEALATRDRILDAAEVLFQRHGVSRTSLQRVATAAGVTRGAVYWHFKGKADLFAAMMQRATLPLEQLLARDTRPGTDADTDVVLRNLHERLVGVLRLAATHPRTRRVFEIATHKIEYVDEMLAVRDRRLLGRNECLLEVERELKCARRRGVIRPTASARTVALGLHALVDGLIQNWMLDPQAFDLARVGAQVLRTYLNGLRTMTSATQPTLHRNRAIAD